MRRSWQRAAVIVAAAGGWSSGCEPKPSTPLDLGAGDLVGGPTLCAIAGPVNCGINNVGRAAQSVASAYPCMPPITVEVSGPEVVYSWTAMNSGMSYVQLEGVSGARLIVLEASSDAQCQTTCVAVGAETAPGTEGTMFAAMAGHQYLAVAESPPGGSLAGYQLYWFCP